MRCGGEGGEAVSVTQWGSDSDVHVFPLLCSTSGPSLSLSAAQVRGVGEAAQENHHPG